MINKLSTSWQSAEPTEENIAALVLKINEIIDITNAQALTIGKLTDEVLKLTNYRQI